jgi:hypothetical protein
LLQGPCLAPAPAEFIFQRLHQLLEVDVKLPHIGNLLNAPLFSPAVLRKDMGIGDRARGAFFSHLNAHHKVKTQKNEIREIFPGQGLAVDMGVEAPQTFEPPQAEPEPAQIRDENVLVVPYDDGNHFSFSAHQERNLSLDLERNGAKLAGQFMGDDFVTGYTATVEVLKKLHVAGF